MFEVLAAGFVMDILKGAVAFASAWLFLYLADKANGTDVRNLLKNDSMSIPQSIFYGSRWLAVSLILYGIFL